MSTEDSRYIAQQKKTALRFLSNELYVYKNY